MSDDAVWKRLDEHSEKIEYLIIGDATTKTELRALERRMDKMLTSITDSLARIEAKQDTSTAYQNRQKGATNFGIWVMGVGLSISALVITIWTTVFGV